MPGGRQVAPQHNQKILKKGFECSVVDEYVKNIQWRQTPVKKTSFFSENVETRKPPGIYNIFMNSNIALSGPGTQFH